MNIQDIIRFWKTDQNEETLPEQQKEHLPVSPVGQIELSDDELEEVAGGGGSGGGVRTSGPSKMEAFTA